MVFTINKKLATLSPDIFETWFKSQKRPGGWKAQYKKIGGNLKKYESKSDTKENTGN